MSRAAARAAAGVAREARIAELVAAATAALSDTRQMAVWTSICVRAGLSADDAPGTIFLAAHGEYLGATGPVPVDIVRAGIAAEATRQRPGFGGLGDDLPHDALDLSSLPVFRAPPAARPLAQRRWQQRQRAAQAAGQASFAGLAWATGGAA